MLVSCRERQSHAGTRERGAVERTHLGNDNCQSDGWTALTLICVFNLGLFDESNCHCGGALVSASQSPAGHWSYTGSSQVKDAFFIFVHNQENYLCQTALHKAFVWTLTSRDGSLEHVTLTLSSRTSRGNTWQHAASWRQSSIIQNHRTSCSIIQCVG